MGFDPAKFKAFIVEKFAKWRGNGRESLDDYAAHIGVSHQVMSNWYNGKLKEPPEWGTFILLVNEYGSEAYEAIGLPSLSDFFAKLPSAELKRFSLAVKEYTDELKSKGIGNDSPEGREIIKKALDKFAVKFNVNSKN